MTEEVKMCLDEAKSGMQKAIDHLTTELSKVRAGKANPSMLSGVMVDAYGIQTPLNQVANVSTPDARTLSIQPWDKSNLQEIERSLMASNLGLTPQNDGEMIRLNIPPLTEERRKDLVKQLKAHGEHAKVSLRSVRKDANDFIKGLQKDGLSEDLAKDAEGEVQNVTNGYAKKADDLVAAKENDIMTI